MSQYHEPTELLDEEAMNFTRALVSLKEEIEAIDWYHQRVVATNDLELRAILEHNRDEEIEHAVMTLEWLRRNMDGWDEEMRTYLFKEGSIAGLEEEVMGGGTTATETEVNDSLKVGDLK